MAFLDYMPPTQSTSHIIFGCDRLLLISTLVIQNNGSVLVSQGGKFSLKGKVWIVSISAFMCQMVSVATIQLCCCMRVVMDNNQMNEHACGPIKLNLRTLKFEFYNIDMYHKIFFFFC